jgi:hypothetical protein
VTSFPDRTGSGRCVADASIAVDGGIVFANPGIKGGGWD